MTNPGMVQAEKNATLHGLRGLLALLVVIFHLYTGQVSAGIIREVSNSWLQQLFMNLGVVPVLLFFSISGYLILQSLARHRNLQRFLLDRVLRIYPVFLIIHLFVFAIGPVIQYKWMVGLSPLAYAGHFFANLFLLPGIIPSLPIAQLVAWSLSFEFAFYLLAGFIFTGLTVPLTDKLARYVLLPVGVLGALIAVYFHLTMCFFLVGVAAFLLVPRLAKYRWHRPFFTLNGVLLFLIVLQCYSIRAIWLSLLLSLLLFIIIIRQEGVLASLLRTRPLQYLGTISYSLYLWHTVIMFPLKKVGQHLGGVTQNPGIIFALLALLTIGLSILVSHYSAIFLEVRLPKWLRRRWSRDERRVPSPEVKPAMLP